jgi:hypothetical protein
MYFDFFTLIVPLLIAATIALQVMATKRIFRDTGFAPEQRRAQMWFVWLVPIFGAATVLAVMHEEPSSSAKSTQPTSEIAKERSDKPRGV